MYKTLLRFYYPIILSVYMLTPVFGNVHAGWIAAALMSMIILSRIANDAGRIKFIGNGRIVLLYGLWMAGSGIQYLTNGIPISLYMGSFFSTILPMTFFFYGEKGMPDDFLRSFMKIYCIVGLIGLVLMVLRPYWYIIYCVEWGYSYIRLSYFIGSITMGCFGAISMMISMKYMIETRGKNYKKYFLISILCTFASWQRSAWIVASIILIISHYLIYYRWKAIKKVFLYLEVIIICAVVFAARDFISEIFTLSNELRVSDKVGMFESRTWTWGPGLQNTNLLFGTGYGSKGHKALALGIEGAIGDGSWIHLVCEIGLIGVGIFLAIIIKCAIKSKRHLKDLYLPIGIIFAICLQSVGSNMFESQLIMPLFWYSVGMIIGYGKDHCYEAMRNANDCSWRIKGYETG